MKKNYSLTVKRLIVGFLITFVTLIPLVAAISIPALAGPVNDKANILTSAEHTKISTFLNGINEQSGIQIAVLTLPNLGDEPIELLSMRVAEAWKLGKKGEDNGVLLLISTADRALRIEVGYGLEGNLTDMKSGLIIRNVISPRFRSGQYGQGIWEGVLEIAEVTAGKAVVEKVSGTKRPDQSAASNNSQDSSPFPGLIILLLFFFLMTRGLGRRGRYGRNGANGLFWGMLLGNILSGSGKSGSSRGGSSGFGGGGGFSGGGGGFGGGGASGAGKPKISAISDSVSSL